MQTTVDFHMNKKCIAKEHNEREPSICENEKHIDLYNTHGNSTHEVWLRTSINDFYKSTFENEIEIYNANQKRKGRMMTVESYMQSILDDTRGKRQTKLVNDKRVTDYSSRQGKQLEYEFTIKLGNTLVLRDENGCLQYDSNNHQIRMEYLPRELQKSVLKRYCQTFAERNSNQAGGLYLTNIDYHADEGYYNKHKVWEYSVDHVHIRYVPVATGFKQGLSKQNSMNKAMAAIGFNGDDCYAQWAKREQAYLEEILHEEYERYCKENPDFYRKKGDLEIKHPVADGEYEGNQEKEIYAQKKELDEREADINSKHMDLNKRIQIYNEKTKALQSATDILEKERQKIEAEKQNLDQIVKDRVAKRIAIQRRAEAMDDSIEYPDKSEDCMC